MSLCQNIYNPRRRRINSQGTTYTPENIKQRILKYETRKELMKKDNGLYQAAMLRGILDEACSHMKNRGYQLYPWTKEELFEIAAKYSTLKEFIKNEPKAYAAFKGSGGRNKAPSKWRKYYEEATAHMTRAKRNPWTKEEILAEAAKIQRNCDIPASLRNALNSHDLTEEGTAHMTVKQRRDWTVEEIKKEILKYPTLKDLFDNFEGRSAYNAAQRRGMLYEACSHMKRTGNILERVVYAFEWVESKTAYIGLTWNTDERKRGHFDKDKDGPVKRYVNEGNEEYDFKVLTDFMLAKEAGAEERRIIQEYKDNGWKLLNKTKGGELGAYIGT